jgi:hypothetical protein
MATISGFVTLDEAKDQVSVELSFDGHNDRLTRLIAAAEKWATGFLNVDSLSDFEDSPVSSPPSLPEDIKSAILMHLEAEFDRDPNTFDLLMKRAVELLWQYRQGLGV